MTNSFVRNGLILSESAHRTAGRLRRVGCWRSAGRSPTGPLATFLLAALAADPIEGPALNKLLGLAFVVPLAAIAAVPEPLQFAAGVLPPYWPAKALVVGVSGGAFWPYLAVGTGYAALLLAAFVRLFRHRVE